MPQPELRGKQGHALPRGQMAARPGSSTAWGWTPKQHQSGGKGGQKPAPWSLGRWDCSRNQAELGQLQQGVAYPEFAPFPTQNTTSSGLQTQPSSGSLCAWRGEAALGRRSPHAWHMQQGTPSPGRGWGLLCVPRHSGGGSGCSPHQCHGHDPAGSAAGVQNLTQKRLGGQRVSTALAENSPGHDAQLAGQGPVLATGRAVSTGSCTRRVTLPLPQTGHGRVVAAAVTAAAAGRRGCRGAGVHWCRCAGMQGCTGSTHARMHRCTDTCAHGCTGTRCRGALTPFSPQGSPTAVSGLLPPWLTCGASDCAGTCQAHLAELFPFWHLGLCQRGNRAGWAPGRAAQGSDTDRTQARPGPARGDVD